MPVRTIDLMLAGLAYQRGEWTLLAVQMLERRAGEEGVQSDSAVSRVPQEVWQLVHRKLFDRLVNDAWEDMFRYGTLLGLRTSSGMISPNASTIDQVYNGDGLSDAWRQHDWDALWDWAHRPMKAFLAAHGLALAEADQLSALSFNWIEYEGLMRPLNITLASCNCEDASSIKLPAMIENEVDHRDTGEGPDGPSSHIYIEPAAIKALVNRKSVVRSFIRRYGIRPEWATSMTLHKSDDPEAGRAAKGDEPQLMIFGHAEYWSVGHRRMTQPRSSERLEMDEDHIFPVYVDAGFHYGLRVSCFAMLVAGRAWEQFRPAARALDVIRERSRRDELVVEGPLRVHIGSLPDQVFAKIREALWWASCASARRTAVRDWSPEEEGCDCDPETLKGRQVCVPLAADDPYSFAPTWCHESGLSIAGKLNTNIYGVFESFAEAHGLDAFGHSAMNTDDCPYSGFCGRERFMPTVTIAAFDPHYRLRRRDRDDKEFYDRWPHALCYIDSDWKTRPPRPLVVVPSCFEVDDRMTDRLHRFMTTYGFTTVSRPQQHLGQRAD